jgi:hypothetical protein
MSSLDIVVHLDGMADALLQDALLQDAHRKEVGMPWQHYIILVSILVLFGFRECHGMIRRYLDVFVATARRILILPLSDLGWIPLANGIILHPENY